MALFDLTPGYILGKTERLTYDKLNRLGAPSARFKLGGLLVENVVSHNLNFSVAEFGTVTTGDVETITHAFVGARPRAIWQLQLGNQDAVDFNMKIELLPYCLTDDVLLIQLRAMQSTDLTEFNNVTARAFMIQF